MIQACRKGEPSVVPSLPPLVAADCDGAGWLGSNVGGRLLGVVLEPKPPTKYHVDRFAIIRQREQDALVRQTAHCFFNLDYVASVGRLLPPYSLLVVTLYRLTVTAEVHFVQALACEVHSVLRNHFRT